MSRLRVGLIGLGFAAWDLKVASYAAIDDVEIVAVADPSPGARERAVAELGVDPARCFADPAELIAAGGVDFVDVSTPHATHHPILLEAARAGIPIACDKPLATTLAHADEILGAAERAGVPIAMFQNFRHFPSHATVARLLEEGAIGTPLYVSIEALGIFAPGVREDEELTWRLRSEVAGGGIVIDYGIHAIYLARLALGEPITRVSAHVDKLVVLDGDVEDQATVRLETASGAHAHLALTWGRGSTGGLTVFGSAGAIKLIHGDGHHAPHNVATGVAVLRDRADQELHDLGWTREPFDWYYRGAIEAFVARLRAAAGGEDPGVAPGTDGRAELEVALAAFASAALGAPVELPLLASDPVYQRGVAGLRDLPLPADSVVLRKGLYAGAR